MYQPCPKIILNVEVLSKSWIKTSLPSFSCQASSLASASVIESWESSIFPIARKSFFETFNHSNIFLINSVLLPVKLSLSSLNLIRLNAADWIKPASYFSIFFWSRNLSSSSFDIIFWYNYWKESHLSSTLS